MRMKSQLLIILSLTLAATKCVQIESSGSIIGCNDSQETSSTDLLQARLFFKHENELLRQRIRREVLAVYNYNTNVTEVNRMAMIEVASANALASKELADRVLKLNYLKVDDPLIQRQAKLFADIGFESLGEADYKKIQNAISSMQSNYAVAKVCSYTNVSDCSLSLEPHLEERLANSRDPEELKYYWREWYDKAGTPMRDNFKEYVQLSKKAAHLNNYRSYAEYWINFYEDPKFEENVEAVYKAILPLYEEIHGYVRYHLHKHYGDGVVPAEGNIPMHLLGDMWAQSWTEPIDLYTPYPDHPFVDVTGEMQRQGYTVHKMFALGDKFFQSLGMIPLSKAFWNLSMFTHPEDRQVICHPFAWDFYQNGDVRIKMCTEVNANYFYIVHHELGHIQYYLQYGHKPTIFRAAPNPGFHEAVGDAIALSVSSPKHLHTIGLSNVKELDEKSRINELFRMALQKIVFIPFAYTLDKYRFAVFRGELNESLWNSGFWQMRAEFGGVEPPEERTDSDFDPTAKYHIAADIEYMRYFAATIFQFQFHKAMCIKAGQYVPGDTRLILDNCDIYKSKEAGTAFSKFLSAGDSRHWKKVLKEFTGESEMNPAALMEYFEPLRRWLSKENKRLGVKLGWK